MSEGRTVLVGLTGGIGAGKSTVARLLAERGALILDADVAAREVVEPGTEGLAAVRDAFGDAVLGPDGALDREALASVVFADDSRRAVLNSIVHPRVRAWMTERTVAAPDGTVVVQDIPLLVESGLAGLFELVVVVDAADAVRISRLVEDRGMTQAQAAARIAAQAPREQRLAVADVVIANDGTPRQLTEQVTALWDRIVTMARAPRPTVGDVRKLRRGGVAGPGG
ncbi:dephospho-CoA kinase [Actinocrinis puniceicyclus]|uniref:Dephospho-CoA kinase n=1 Tax=Actinocrinis puniceicyclus TaxID=977794 RepID=A0A8J8BBP0_9ACTN|nr:dephospho-CoA kinase [Actinocrinis puniceicyclus]MBS2962665.1 dephospho-CoA kinase [Actinocrinis puniceicyclus]